MNFLLTSLLNPYFFWVAWILIPLVMEIIPAFGSIIVLFIRLHRPKENIILEKYPEITVIVPVYNSADTLEQCINSIDKSTYPNKSIRIFIVYNGGNDESFDVFSKCQIKYSNLSMQWLNAEQGKSRALNMAIYNSGGKYIIHVDSDGFLEKDALMNIVKKFESDTKISCMTGTILTDPEQIEQYTSIKSKTLRKMEFMEYAQAFMAGRNYASEFNAIYTLSGAFSAFRESVIRQSYLYNTNTICEDTEITFQMKYLQHERVWICEDAIFFVSPIENMDKLYTQRQRWQRGSLEVAKIFLSKSKLAPYKIFTDVNIKTLMYDHTFAFPRLIWYLALVCLMFVGYSGKTVLLSTVIMFGFYIFCGYLYFFATIGFMKGFYSLKKYYERQWKIVALLPGFNLLVFFIRFAGVINSIGTNSEWKTKTFTEEKAEMNKSITSDIKKPISLFIKIKGVFNES